MCAIVLLKTGNLLWCILLHAIYDFCGQLIPTIGAGALWDTPTVVLTAILGVAVLVWMLTVFFHITPESIPNFYQNGEKEYEHSENQ
jgi:F0F1-type ATP synthase membrane subunit a